MTKILLGMVLGVAVLLPATAAFADDGSAADRFLPGAQGLQTEPAVVTPAIDAPRLQVDTTKE